MKAARLYGVGDLRVEEVDRPALSADDEVLIRIHACGICPSDLRAYTGARPASRSLTVSRRLPRDWFRWQVGMSPMRHGMSSTGGCTTFSWNWRTRWHLCTERCLCRGHEITP